ncbi:PepSY domain-containing protein [Microvirga tunisiensis]|uniref:PepSY domain-containing protein n=1 Tax=Pannonibacter tanglangensis TaxID=2750084 RepID=A0A7X5F5W6_9HYPH|nr:PepSY domain-containing protein [Pannonibacter sp. XCT-53]
MTDMTSETAAGTGRAGTDHTASFYRAAWRWHFYAGLYVAPFLIMLAVTGLIMMWTAVIEGRDGEYRYAVTPAASVAPVSAQVAAASAANGGAPVRHYIAPRNADGTALVRVDGAEGPTVVAVNPYTAEVIESWPRRAGLYDLASDIHGTLLIGDLGDRLIEIAASLAFVLIVTGLYMWWPREEGAGRVLLPDLRASGRKLMKSLHVSVGFYSALLLVAFLLSGLAWAGIWGDRYVQAWSTFPAEKWDNVPLSDATHASMNHGGQDVAWGMQKTPMPESGSAAGVTGVPAGTPVTADSIAALARAIGMEGRFQMAFPKGETGVWTLSQDSMSNDTGNPADDRTVHIDQYTGKIIAVAAYADYSIPAKAMAIGIALHEGDMGWWNITLNTVFCLSIVFLSVSGLVMWWQRRPKGAALRLLPPQVPVDMPHWRSAMLVMLLVAFAFPLAGLTMIAVLALDLLVISRLPALRRALR